MRNVRIFYRKKGNMKFVSHLDMNRFMIRIVRRAEIPVWYSEGFNPHPYITFALPLSLGFESDYEVMDMRIEDENFTNRKVFNSLAENMPQGIEIFACEPPLMKTGEVAYADYIIDFDTDLVDIKDQLSEFFSANEIIAEKKTKKGAFKLLNLKEFIKEYEIGKCYISLTLSAGGSNNLNPKLLLDTFCKATRLELPSYSVTRTMLYNANMQKFE